MLCAQAPFRPWTTQRSSLQPIADRGIILTAIQAEPVARAAAQSLSVGVAELDLDVLVIGFHRSWTDPELFGDPIRSQAGANQPKNVQLAIGQVTGVAIYSRVFD